MIPLDPKRSGLQQQDKKERPQKQKWTEEDAIELG